MLMVRFKTKDITLPCHLLFSGFDLQLSKHSTASITSNITSDHFTVTFWAFLQNRETGYVSISLSSSNNSNLVWSVGKTVNYTINGYVLTFLLCKFFFIYNAKGMLIFIKGNEYIKYEVF